MGDGRNREWWTFIPEHERALYQNADSPRETSFDGKPALLVIDVTHNFTGTRPLPISEAIKEFPTSCGEAAWAAIPQIHKLLDAFRSESRPVVYTGRDVAAQEAHSGSTKRRGNIREGNGFVDQVRPREGEWICTKARASAFYGTSLDAYLRINRVQTLVVVGGSTSGCVRASCVDAFLLVIKWSQSRMAVSTARGHRIWRTCSIFMPSTQACSRLTRSSQRFHVVQSPLKAHPRSLDYSEAFAASRLSMLRIMARRMNAAWPERPELRGNP